MQNSQTLISLGFLFDDAEQRYILKGKKQTFLAYAYDSDRFPYVRLYMYSEKIDTRPLSKRNGRPFINPIKDCISNGSVERAIKAFDTDYSNICFGIGTATIINNNK